jgi:hypothetical protein
VKSFFLVIIISLLSPVLVFARTTPNDLYQEKRATFDAVTASIKDEKKKENIILADRLLDNINQSVCNRFDVDAQRLAAIMEELKRRKGITSTRVAYGSGSTKIEQADYYVNFAAEAIAYQKSQNYTPTGITEKNLSKPVSASMGQLRSDLQTLKGKVLRAKQEVQNALNEK